MSLLTISEAVAKDIGIAVPTAVFGSTDRTLVELLEIINASGEEIARRVDWGELTASATLTGDGTNKVHAIAGLSRITAGQAMTGAGGVIRPLTRPEWTMTATEGVPRYFLLEGQNVTLWPYLANAITASVTYQTENWCENGTAAFGDDGDAALIPEVLLEKCAMVRWRRQHGMDYADHEMEYEAAIADYARFNDRSRL